MKIEAYMSVDPQGGALFFRNDVRHVATIPLVSGYALAASQAYAQTLREVLKTLASCTAREGAYGRALQKTISDALSLPQDDTALRQQNAKLLREMADKGWPAWDSDDLRLKADELEAGK